MTANTAAMARIIRRWTDVQETIIPGAFIYNQNCLNKYCARNSKEAKSILLLYFVMIIFIMFGSFPFQKGGLGSVVCVMKLTVFVSTFLNNQSIIKEKKTNMYFSIHHWKNHLYSVKRRFQSTDIRKSIMLLFIKSNKGGVFLLKIIIII